MGGEELDDGEGWMMEGWREVVGWKDGEGLQDGRMERGWRMEGWRVWMME